MTTGLAGPFPSGIENHPGHDQKSHGRKGSGVRDVLTKAKTIGELNGATAAELKRITGRDTDVDFAGSDLQVAKEHAEGILQGAEKFPEAPVRTIGTYGTPQSSDPEMAGDRNFASTFYGHDGDDIFFNNAYSAGEYRDSLARSELRGVRTIATPTPTGVALHEFGHVVSMHSNSEATAGAIARRRAEGDSEPVGMHVARQISTYAMTSNGELAAEAFADVMVNGSGASGLSREIYDDTATAYQHQVAMGTL